VDRPASVGFEQLKYAPAAGAGQMADHTFFYDAAGRNLHIRVHVKAMEDSIVNLAF
jgi:hypothetical protein